MNKAFIVLSLTLLLTGNALAETLYISDRLEVTMRKGKSTGHNIVRMLRSGTAVEVLGKDKKSGYTHIRTKSGKEGWVLSRFLMQGRAAREQLTSAEKKLAQLELKNRKLGTSMQALEAEKTILTKERSSLYGEHRKVSQELSEIKRTASSALAIDSENKTIKSRLISLERELQTTKQENESLKDRTARDWFMVGGGVVLLGIIVGLIIPRIRWRKKSSWDQF